MRGKEEGQDLVHLVDHGLLEPCLSFVRVTFAALDHDLVGHPGYGLKELGFVQFGYRDSLKKALCRAAAPESKVPRDGLSR